jgi:hypothetical protein
LNLFKRCLRKSDLKPGLRWFHYALKISSKRTLARRAFAFSDTWSRPVDCHLLFFWKFKATYWKDARTQWWLSASDYCNEGAWRWCYGNQRVQFFDNSTNHFVGGEPNNMGSEEHCGALIDTDTFSGMGVNDFPCINWNSFICEVQRSFKKCDNIYLQFQFQAPINVTTTPFPQCPGTCSVDVNSTVSHDSIFNNYSVAIN